MERRAFLGVVTSGLLAAPLAAWAQQAGKAYRVGVLSIGTKPTPAPPSSPFRDGLLELGWVEGKNLILESRYADLKEERLPILGSDAVASAPGAAGVRIWQIASLA